MIPVRGLLPLALILATAALTWWLYQQTLQDRPRNDGSQRHDPDAFIEDVDLSTLDAQGRLEHRLWAKRLEHFPDDDSTQLNAPYMELYGVDEPPWRIRSQQGWVSSGGAEVLLEGEVEILRDGNERLRPAKFYTSKLRIFPDRDYAETDAAITYRSTGLEVRSLGMNAYLDKGQVELLSRVRAVHQSQEGR